MAGCYTDDVVFRDPVFGQLAGDDARAMWAMLCEQGKDLAVTFGDIAVNDHDGSASWEAVYTFSPTGRKVHNRIHASFRFRDGLISHHEDDFDLWRWTRMALGPIGWTLGWSPLVRDKVRSTARANLDRYLDEQGPSASP